MKQHWCEDRRWRNLRQVPLSIPAPDHNLSWQKHNTHSAGQYPSAFLPDISHCNLHISTTYERISTLRSAQDGEPAAISRPSERSSSHPTSALQHQNCRESPLPAIHVWNCNRTPWQKVRFYPNDGRDSPLPVPIGYQNYSVCGAPCIFHSES